MLLLIMLKMVSNSFTTALSYFGVRQENSLVKAGHNNVYIWNDDTFTISPFRALWLTAVLRKFCSRYETAGAGGALAAAGLIPLLLARMRACALQKKACALSPANRSEVWLHPLGSAPL